MLRRIWHSLFGGCLHEYRWHEAGYSNAYGQIGECQKCGYQKERVIYFYKKRFEDTGSGPY